MEDQIKWVNSTGIAPNISQEKSAVVDVTSMNSGHVCSPVEKGHRDIIEGTNDELIDVSVEISDLSIIQEYFYDKWESDGLANEEADENWRYVLNILRNRHSKEYSNRELCGKKFIVFYELPSLPDLIKQSAKDYMKRSGIIDSEIEKNLRTLERLQVCIQHNSKLDSLLQINPIECSEIHVTSSSLGVQYMGKPVSVGEVLCIGAGFIAYDVIIDKVHMVLKVYEKLDEKTMENIFRLLEGGKPHDTFWWPEGILSINGSLIGLLFQKIPDSFIILQDNIHMRIKEIPLKRTIRACVELVTALRILHSKGELYNELGTEKIYIDSKTGKILIEFCENTSEYANEDIVCRSFKFTAPNVLRGESQYDVNAERYALAVILFYLLFGMHPLIAGLDDGYEKTDFEAVMRQFVSNPMFVFSSPEYWKKESISVQLDDNRGWDSTPEYIKEMFIAQFSRTNLFATPERRATESQWQEAFVHYLSDLWNCPKCGALNCRFDTQNICRKCEKEVVINNYISSPRIDYKIPIIEGLIIYRLQLMPTNIDSSNALLFYVRKIQNEASTLCIQNISNDIIDVEMPDGRVFKIKKGGAFRALSGLIIKFGTKTCGKIE